MIGNLVWYATKGLPLSGMSFRVCFFVYCRGLNRNCFSKLIFRCSFTRHILRSCSFSLCFKNRGSICPYRGICKLVSVVKGSLNKSLLVKNSVLFNVCRGKSNFFSNAFFRVSRDTTTLLRLPRQLFYLKPIC